MLIRSKDKRHLVPLNREIYAPNDDTKTILADNGGSEEDTMLGQYDSDERCIQILNEIQQKYAEYISVKGGPLYTSNNFVQPSAFDFPKVYQMPEK